MIDFEDLNNHQRKILRAALMDIFDAGEEDLDLILSDAGLKTVKHMARGTGWETRLNDTLRYLQKRPGKLTQLMTAVGESDFAETREFLELPRLLAAADSSIVDELEKHGRNFDALARSATALTGPASAGFESVDNPPQARLEKYVRKAEFHHLYVWSAMFEDRGRSLCKISCAIGDQVLNGTGIRIGPAQVLTNFHVVDPIVKAGIDPADIRISFDFAETAAGVTSQVEPLASDWLGATAPIGSITNPQSGDLDFAILNLAAARPDEAYTALTEVGPLPEPGSVVFVFQHPGGMTLRHSIGVVRAGGEPLRLRYDANTLRGSSGGLLLDEKLRPVALHHAGLGVFGSGYNQGVPLTRIRDAIRAA